MNTLTVVGSDDDGPPRGQSVSANASAKVKIVAAPIPGQPPTDTQLTTDSSASGGLSAVELLRLAVLL